MFLLPNTFSRTYDHLVHLTDWYPTLLSLAGIDTTAADLDYLDGVDQFKTLFQNVNPDVPPRDLVVNEIATAGIDDFRCAVQDVRGWKLVKHPRYTPAVGDKYLLFNVRDDPSETTDYKTEYPEILEEMKSLVKVSH